MPAVELIVENLEQPHGLAFDADDQLFVAEVAAKRVTRITTEGKLSPFADTGGRPMGIAFDDSGDLFVAENGRHHLLLVSPDEAVEVFANQSHGRRFFGPRALCFTHEGGVIFSDADPEGQNGALFLCDLNGEVEKIADGLSSPMGLALLDDSVTLFVSESTEQRIVSFELDEDGIAKNREVFAEFSDGEPGSLLLDSQGVLLVAVDGVGITQLDPDGTIVDTWKLPNPRPMDMTFGGINYDQLFVSEFSGAIYQLPIDHTGQRPFAGPRSV